MDSLFGKKANLAEDFVSKLPVGTKPERAFHYIYAIMHSPTYRKRYVEFLTRDFARIPVASDKTLFSELADKGGKLVDLHLLKSPVLDDLLTGFPEKGTNEVTSISYFEKDSKVWINPIQFFAGVPKAVWEFVIGDYVVCERWLADRKGRNLTYDNIQHWQRIVVAIKETFRLMKEIDALIPGWPLP